MGEVVSLPGLTTQPIPVEDVIEGAKQHDYDEVLIIGFNKEARLVAASSHTDKSRLLLLVNLFAHKLLAGDFDDES